MNDLKSFNETMQYIEDQLDGTMDYQRVGQLAGCPASLFGRIFTVMSGIPLGEYIRLRKLSKAAWDLQNNGEKVIDVALRYGYESVDAFSAAFRRFHGQSPSDVKKGGAFQVLPPVHFSLQVEGGNKMDVRFEKKDGFAIAGLSMEASFSADFPALWGQLFDKVDEGTLVALGNGQSYGACYDMTEDERFCYMAGFNVQEGQDVAQLGLERLTVPDANYAIVKLTGPVPECIHQGWKYLMGTFFPQQGYCHAGSPDFEVYAEGDMSAPDYSMELWVPVVKE